MDHVFLMVPSPCKGQGLAFFLLLPLGNTLSTSSRCIFPGRSLPAEYEGLLAGLRIATKLGIKKLIIRGDSQLVVKQINKHYQSPLMEAYVEEVRKLEERFDGLQTERVPHAENNIADHLSKCAAQKLPVEPGTYVLHLTQPPYHPQ